MNIFTGLLIKIREFHERIEDEDFHSKFDEFEDLGEFDLFASKEPCSIRVRGLQVSVVQFNFSTNLVSTTSILKQFEFTETSTRLFPLPITEGPKHR
jgi:hypothetical protein